MYEIISNICVKGKDGYVMHRNVPTFYLDANLQGIISESHACIIARDILDPFGNISELTIHASRVTIRREI